MKKMKRKAICALSTLLFLASLFSITVPQALAYVDASDYFSYTDVWATAQSGGKVLVEFDINATHKMLEVGASKIYIYEQQSNGDYIIVHTYSRYDTPGLIDTNSSFGGGEVTYQGTPGVKYFATLALYAQDSAGNETLYFDTNVVTAKWF